MDLAEYLFRNKIKQRDFAFKVSISSQYLNSYLKGRSNIGPKTALVIQTVTNGEVTVEEIMLKNKKERKCRPTKYQKKSSKTGDLPLSS